MIAGLWRLAMLATLIARLAADAGLEERVEVKALLPDAEDTAAFATTLDATGLERRGADLADLLRSVPGARVRDYGGLGSFATVSLRASTSEQVTVLVDGVPQNRALGGPVDLSWIPATQLSRVTVFRGFGPAGLGHAGIGGVVDVRTRPPGPDPDGRLDLVAGGLGTARLSTGWSAPLGPSASLRVGAERLVSRGDFEYLDTNLTPFEPADDVVRRRRNNDVAQTSLLLQGVWRAVGPGSLRVSLRDQRRDRGVPGLGARESDVARLEEGLEDLNVAWSGRFVDLLFDAFRQESRFKDPDGDVGLQAGQDERTVLHGGGVAAVAEVPTGRHRLLVRLDARLEQARVRDAALVVTDRGGVEREALALAIEERLSFGRLTLSPSLRGSHRRDDFVAAGDGLLPPPAPDASDTEITGTLGVSLTVSAHTAVRGSIGTFHRGPSLLELFGDRGSVRGNPGLRPERGTSAEVGVVRRFGSGDLRAEAEIVAFGRDTEDLILLWPTSLSSSVARNLGAAEVRGVEASLTLALPHGFSVDAAGTLQSTEDTSGGFSDGKPLVYHPERQGYLGLGLTRGPWSLHWEVTYVGENSADALDTPLWRMPSRVVHDVAVDLAAGAGFSVGLEARNLFDRQVRDVARYPLPDRVLLLHLGWRDR